MTATERFMFETCGFLLVPGALSAAEVAACLAASERVHSNDAFVTRQLAQQGDGRNGEHDDGVGDNPNPLLNSWRQLDNCFEEEPAFEPLIDHPSVIEKVRALFGDTFILHSSWNTMVPTNFEHGFGFHQDGTGAYDFKRMGNANGLAGEGGPTPLVQLRIGFVLTDLSEPGAGNLALIPGSHNSRMQPPSGLHGPEDLPIAQVICAAPGTAILFHQGTYHSGTANRRPHNRYMQVGRRLAIPSHSHGFHSAILHY